jgi:D-alanine-D-alanine ligase
VDNASSVTPGIYGYKAKTLHNGEDGVPGFLCPADVEIHLAEKLQTLAIRAHLAIGATDVSRVDIRLDAEGNPRLLEINTLPGLTPDFSDLCVIAKAEGISYADLILEILDLGASRYGLLPERGQEAEKPLRIPALIHMLPTMATMMLN